MSKKMNATIATAALLSTVVLGGCGLIDNKEIDPPQSESIVEDKEALDKADETIAEQAPADQSIMTELYLIDKKGYVVPQSNALPGSEGIAKQALQYLVDQGPVSNVLPNGFRAVLPADTEVDLDIKEGVATVDLSPEFANYAAEDELKILQSITWTLTQFDSVNSVKLKMNGYELTEMPVNKTPISSALSRANGINLDTEDVVDVTNTMPLTVYYLGGKEENYYYVPVTKRVSPTGEDIAETVVKELADGPAMASSLVTEFMPELALIEDPVLDDGKLALNFNESIYGSFEEQVVSQRLLDALVLSLTEQPGIDSVEVLVNGKASLKTEEGKELSEPVSRPAKVNKSSL